MEYPFKDLLPLDEVLEREGYYRDWTHLDPKVFYSLTQISEYIKTKGFGVDVRLLIAQLAEHFGLKTTQVVDLANLLQQKFDNLEGVTQSFTNNINSLVAQMEADKNAVIANVTVDSEVILARDGETTLGERLTKDFGALTDEIRTKVKHLNYEMFGINGDKKYFNSTDGKYYLDEAFAQEYTEDDGEAIKAVHELAATSGLPIVNVSGEYVIRDKRHIPITTNTDLGNSVFHIDEKELEGYPFVFRITSKFDEVEITPPVSTLKKRQLEIPEMAQFEGHVAIFEDENSAVGRRYGGTSTKTKRDLSYIGQGGALDGEISWDYDQITKVIVKKVDETYLTFEGGNLVYSGYLTSPSSDYVHQGVLIERSKTIIKNQRVNYELVDASQATQYGLYQINRCYDVTFDKVDLPSRSDTNGSSYGITAGLVTKLQFKNMCNFATSGYWGVMGTNEIKDMSFDNCDLGRIDTHFHLWGLTIKDTRVNSIHITGGGTLRTDRVEVRSNGTGSDATFINFRDDYGSIWDGDISIENCKLRILNSGDFNAFALRFGAGDYDFSQDIYWGRKITIDNLDIDYEAGDNNGDAYVIYLSNARDFGGRRPYFPSKITARNMDIHGRDKGYRFISGINISEALSHRDGSHLISPKEVHIQPNAFYEFDSIYTSHRHNHSNSLGGHIGFSNPNKSPTDANSPIPRILIRNCKHLSISTRNIVCELIIENSEVSTLHAEKNAKVKLISVDIKPDFTSVENSPNAFSLGGSEVHYLGCKIFPLKHDGTTNLGWNRGRTGIYDIGSISRTVYKGNHVGTLLSPEILDDIDEISTWSTSNKEAFFKHLRSSPMAAQYEAMDYGD